MSDTPSVNKKKKYSTVYAANFIEFKQNNHGSGYTIGERIEKPKSFCSATMDAFENLSAN